MPAKIQSWASNSVEGNLLRLWRHQIGHCRVANLIPEPHHAGNVLMQAKPATRAACRRAGPTPPFGAPSSVVTKV
jgi:hypothetical protein